VIIGSEFLPCKHSTNPSVVSGVPQKELVPRRSFQLTLSIKLPRIVGIFLASSRLVPSGAFATDHLSRNGSGITLLFFCSELPAGELLANPAVTLYLLATHSKITYLLSLHKPVTHWSFMRRIPPLWGQNQVR